MTQEDREMLIRIHENTTDLKKAVFGNGSPGLVSRMRAVEVAHDECQKNRSKTSQWPSVVAAVCAVAAVVWGFLTQGVK